MKAGRMSRRLTLLALGSASLVVVAVLVAAGVVVMRGGPHRRAVTLVQGPSPWDDSGTDTAATHAAGRECASCHPGMPGDSTPRLAEPIAPGESGGGEEGEGGGGPERRLSWFWRQRAYPLDTVPVDANVRAVRQAQGMMAAQSPAQSWTSLGPAPIEQGLIGIEDCVGDDCQTWRTNVSGRVKAIAFQPGNSNVIYVATATGGVWKSNNGGSSFAPLTDGQPAWAFFSLAIDPGNPNVVYAGTGEISGFYGVGLLKSTNGGQNWTRLGESEFAGLVISSILINPNDSNTLYVATAHPLDLMGQNTALPGVFRSTDGGQTWQGLLTCTKMCYGFSDLVMEDTDPRVMYAAFAGGGIYKTTDGGDQWTLLTGGFPDRGFTRIELGIGRGDGAGTLYAGLAARVSQGGQITPWGLIYKSTDHGETWQSLDNAPNYCSSQCVYDNVVTVDPRDANVVYIGGNLSSEGARWNGVVYKSIDGGATWQDMTPGTALNRMVHPDMHAITLDPADPDKVWVGNDGGLYRSPDGGETWQSRNLDLATMQFVNIGVHPTNPNIAFGGLQDNAKAKYDGTRWVGMDSGDGGYSAIDPFNPSIWYSTRYSVQGSTIQFQRNTLGGTAPLQDWPQLSDGLDINDRVQFYVPFELDPSTPGAIYLGTHRLYRTGNRGESWTPISGDLTKGEDTGGSITAIGVAPRDPNTIYVGTSDGNVQVTANLGTSWANVTRSPLPNRHVSDFAVDPASARTAYVVFNGYNTHTPETPGHVFKTTNAGESWQDVSGNLPDVPVLTIFADPQQPGHVYVGTDVGIFRSTNGGGSWASYSAGLPTVPVYDLEYQAATRTLWAGTYGRGVYRLSLTGGATPTPSPTRDPARIRRLYLPAVLRRGAPPQATPTPPAAGPAPGSWAGERASFSVSTDQRQVWDLRFLVPVPGCETWVTYADFSPIGGAGFSVEVDLRENGVWRASGQFLSRMSAAGTAEFDNVYFGTSCGTWSGTVNWTATWQSSSTGPTPAPTATPRPAGPTPTPESQAGIHGQVRYAGRGVEGITLILRRCPEQGECDLDASRTVTTTTDAGGYYSLTGVPDLGANDYYFVFYLNGEQGGNTPDDHYLWRWYGPPINTYTAGDRVGGGSFDIDDIELLGPEEASATLPATFTWSRRNIPGEYYAWELFDPETGDTKCDTNPAPDNRFTLTESEFLGRCGGQYGVTYGWFAWAVTGSSWEQGYGDSYYYTEITFAGPGGPTPTATPTRLTATPTPTPAQGIFGQVRYQGSGAGGVSLILNWCLGTTCLPIDSTTSDTGGNYLFTDVAGLGSGEKYYVSFENGVGGNGDDPARLAFWRSYDIMAYTSGSSLDGGSFDIADVRLQSPPPDASTTLPASFAWFGRGVANDFYSLTVANASGEDLCWIVPPGANTSYVFTLSDAAVCGLSYDTPYRWYVKVTAADSFDKGYGASYYYRTITFRSSSRLKENRLMRAPAPHVRPAKP